MSRHLLMYRVNLKFFAQVCGSKDQSLLDQAFHYLEQGLAFCDNDEQVKNRKFYERHLHQIIYNGVVLNNNVPKEYSCDDQIITEQATLVDVIKAIFAQDSSFKFYGGSNLWRYLELYKDIKVILDLDETSQKLWNYILTGRGLGNGTTSGEYYYGYLINSEIPLVLEGIYSYRPHNYPIVESLRDTLEDVLDSGMDFFVEA